MKETGLPRSFELAWGVREQPTKGPRRALSLAEIIAAGVTVADTDGLAAVSMSRVASDLGMSTMALYRYVAAKGELIVLMADASYGDPPKIGHDWRAGLTAWAVAMRAGLHAHPWAVQVPISGPPTTPNSVAWMEVALRCMQGTGLGHGEQVATLLLLSGHVRSHVLMEAQLSAAAAASGTSPAGVAVGYGKLLRSLTEREGFPALHQLIDSGVFDEPEDDPDRDFRYGVDRILDGIAAHVTVSAAGSGER